MNTQSRIASTFFLASLGLSQAANAHVEISSGPGFSGTSQEITLAVGHGCSGADTFRIEVEIPEAVTSVRTGTSNLGPASVVTDQAGLVETVTWEKSLDDLLEHDTGYYKMTLRIKVPAAPFTTLYFPVHQTCRTLEGVETTVDWTTTPTSGDPNGEPAGALKILPPRQPGWNQFVVPAAIPDLLVYFSDAAIVWKGSAAYSANAATMTQISATADVTALTALAANDSIWVKY